MRTPRLCLKNKYTLVMWGHTNFRVYLLLLCSVPILHRLGQWHATTTKLKYMPIARMLSNECGVAGHMEIDTCGENWGLC